MRRIRRLTTVRQIAEAIDASGAKGEFTRLVKCWSKLRPKQSAYNYKRANRLPPKSSPFVIAKLEEIGCTAPSSLFGMPEPKKARAA